MAELVDLPFGEEIRDVPGYEGLYMITNHGRVWSCGRDIESTNQYGPCVKSLKAKWLKPGIDGSGYKCVKLSKDDETKTMKIHRLVSEAFIPNTLNLPEINHIDGNKLNSHFLNLEWVTRQQNKNHAIETRLHHPNRTSEFYGVSWHKRNKKWGANICIRGKVYHIGQFNDELDAAKAWDDYLNEHNITDRLFNRN